MGAYRNAKSDVEAFKYGQIAFLIHRMLRIIQVLRCQTTTIPRALQVVFGNFKEDLHRPFTSFASVQLRRKHTPQKSLDNYSFYPVPLTEASSSRHSGTSITSTEHLAAVKGIEIATVIGQPSDFVYIQT